MNFMMNMDTEDSQEKCVRILKRSSPSDMIKAMDEWVYNKEIRTLKSHRRLLKDHGWTVKEFYDEYGHRRFPR